MNGIQACSTKEATSTVACHGSNLELTYLSIFLISIATCWSPTTFSKFPVVKKLTNQTVGHVISLLNTIFAEYGVPATVYTDQATQFVSQQFKEFALQYRFEVQHSSLRYPQSNGFIEAMVKVVYVKGIMENAEESDSDPHLAMLIYGATPFRPGQLSPGEMLSQRKY